jgi:hypothetical protein
MAREIFTPTVDASGQGTRRRFSRSDLLQLAIVAELQTLFGAHLRPGAIAADVAEWVETSGGWPSLKHRADDDPGVVTFTVREGRTSVTPSAASKVARAIRNSGVTVVVNYGQLVRRIEAALAEQ